MGNRLRVLGSVRLSRATTESTSPARQRERIEWWAQGHNVEVVHITEDIDISGAVSPFERPGLGEWLTPQRAKEYDVLVAWRLDRLSRSAEDTHRLLQFAEEHNIRIVCVDDGIDTDSSMGRVMMQLAAVFAEVERTAIRERVLASRAKLRSDGRWSGGAPAYGLKAVPNDNGPGYRLSVDPEAYPHVRHMVERVLAGDSLNSIAADLNRRGVLTPQDLRRKQHGKPLRGGKWHPSSIRSVLTSHSLRGVMSHDGRAVYDPQSGLPVPAGEAVVTSTEWAELQARLVAGVRRRRTQTPSLLLGVAFCAKCGSRLYRQEATRRGRRYAYYRCASVVLASRSEIECGAPSIHSDELEMFVEQHFLDEIGDIEVTEDVFVPGSDISAELAEAKAAYEELTGLLPALRSDHARRSTRAQLAALDARIDELSSTPSTPDRWEKRGTGQTYRQAWAAADVTERRRLLLDTGVRVKAKAKPFEADFWFPIDEVTRIIPEYQTS